MKSEQPLTVRVEADRLTARYLNCEPAVFTVGVYRGDQLVTRGEVDIWLAKDGGPAGIRKATFDLAVQNPCQVVGSVDEPAFFLCQAWATVDRESGYGEKVVWYRAPVNPAQVTVTLLADRPEALYRGGETATFTATVAQDGKPVTDGRLELRLSREGADADIARQAFDLAQGRPLNISGALTGPGFLYCQATLTRDAGSGPPITAWTSAGYDVDGITPETAMPGDFKDFWAQTLAQARQLPMDVALEKLERLSNARATYYRFSINTLNDERVYGFLGVPGGPGPFPVIAMYPGAGHGFGVPIDQGFTSRGAITLMMNVHKYPVAESAEEAQQQMERYVAQHGASRYFSVGVSSRDTYHFHGILAGFCRALDYLCTRDDWDGKRLMVFGSSQGGFLTLAMSALYAGKVSSAMAGVPLCDVSRACQQRHWHKGAAVEYYDGVNFARSIRCPIQLSVAFGDSSCQPGSVLGAYNVIPGSDKKIRMEPRDSHGITPERQAMERECVIRGLGL